MELVFSIKKCHTISNKTISDSFKFFGLKKRCECSVKPINTKKVTVLLGDVFMVYSCRSEKLVFHIWCH